MRISDIWHTIQGAGKYLACPRADDAVAWERMQKCARCPSLTVRRIPIVGGAGVYCGEALENRLKDPAPTCGCLVGAVDKHALRRIEERHGAPDEVRAAARGAMLPGGKVTCAGEVCPQGKW